MVAEASRRLSPLLPMIVSTSISGSGIPQPAHSGRLTDHSVLLHGLCECLGTCTSKIRPVTQSQLGVLCPSCLVVSRSGAHEFVQESPLLPVEPGSHTGP